MRRVLGQSEELLRDMQTLNIEYPRLRNKLLQSLCLLVSRLEQGDLSGFLESVQAGRRFFEERKPPSESSD